MEIIGCVPATVVNTTLFALVRSNFWFSCFWEFESDFLELYETHSARIFSVEIASGVYSLNQPKDTQLSFRNLFHQVDLHSFVRFSDLDDFFVEHFNAVSKRFILSLNNSLQGRIHLELLINVVKCEITCLHSFSQELMHPLPKLMYIVMVSFHSVITMSHV